MQIVLLSQDLMLPWDNFTNVTMPQLDWIVLNSILLHCNSLVARRGMDTKLWILNCLFEIHVYVFIWATFYIYTMYLYNTTARTKSMSHGSPSIVPHFVVVWMGVWPHDKVQNVDNWICNILLMQLLHNYIHPPKLLNYEEILQYLWWCNRFDLTAKLNP